MVCIQVYYGEEALAYLAHLLETIGRHILGHDIISGSVSKLTMDTISNY